MGHRDDSASYIKVFFAQVMEASEATGIAQNQIFPIRNYTREWECDLNVDILILHAFRQILRNAEDFLADKIEREQQEIKAMTERVRELGGRRAPMGSGASASGKILVTGLL